MTVGAAVLDLVNARRLRRRAANSHFYEKAATPEPQFALRCAALAVSSSTSMNTHKQPKAAPYPASDHAEVSAIAYLKVLLSHRQIKPDIKERDKTPNYDGIVEILDDTLRPLGKLEVQVKRLNEKDRSRGGYSCGKELLAYARGASLPVLLVAVSPEGEVARWVELSRPLCGALLAELGAGASITVRFPPENVIRPGGVAACLEDWRRIVAAHVNRVASFDEMEIQYRRLRTIEEALWSIGKGLPTDDAQTIAVLQAHLAELNRLLSDQFSIVRRSFFAGAWQVGIAFSDYTDKSISYCYYPIRPGTNDLPIKRIPGDALRNLDGATRTSWFQDNPIMRDPVGHARSYVAGSLAKLFDLSAFEFTEDSLLRELIFAACDALAFPLGLDRKNAYAIEELLYAWRTYLPHWLQYVFDATPREHMLGVLQGASVDGYLRIDTLAISAGAGGKSRVEIDKEVRQRIGQGPPPEFPIPIGVRDLPIRHVPALLNHLSLSGAKSVSRLYKPLDFSRPRSSGMVFDLLSPDDLVSNVRTFYECLPVAFDHVVALNTPRLRRPPKYWDEWDRVIVSVEAGQPVPVLRDWHLRGGGEKRVEVMTEEFRLQLIGTPRDGEFDGKKFETIEAGMRSAGFLFQKHPLLTAVCKLLKARFSRLDPLLD